MSIEEYHARQKANTAENAAATGNTRLKASVAENARLRKALIYVVKMRVCSNHSWIDFPKDDICARCIAQQALDGGR